MFTGSPMVGAQATLHVNEFPSRKGQSTKPLSYFAVD